MQRLGYIEHTDLNIQRALGQTAAQVYALVKTFAKLSDGVCSASGITIADQLGLSWKSVSRALKLLEQEGLIRCIGTSQELKTKQYVPVRGAWKKFQEDQDQEQDAELSKSNKYRRYGGNRPNRKPSRTRAELKQRQEAVTDFHTHIAMINRFDSDTDLFGDTETPEERELRRKKEDQLLVYLGKLAGMPREQLDELLESRRMQEAQRRVGEVAYVR